MPPKNARSTNASPFTPPAPQEPQEPQVPFSHTEPPADLDEDQRIAWAAEDAARLKERETAQAALEAQYRIERQLKAVRDLMEKAKTLTSMFTPNATAPMNPDAPSVIKVKSGTQGRQRAFVIPEMDKAVSELEVAVAAAYAAFE